ncbi:phosphopentomutase [Heliobacterium undosum]|uniref:Phosphopentomutase n=1 Tax=Heliomicrobium undosum TaxID=121734 RepID=A0A845L0X8_9FIRM|nr:phosphopentomutase [Heliomicrobium undosum]MZP28424.1 phosphopentomutase [Heliomicrobium undosum]
MKKRVILIVLDSVGIGELPDADRYGDRGSHTLGNIARAVGGLRLPHLAKLGLGNIDAIDGVAPVERPEGAFGKMAERAPGKDTTTGHWELAGVVLDKPFPVYPDGFPPEVMEAFEKAIGRSTLGNVAASGTEIIERLGEEHMATGAPIVYTSADSVFQIAAHEEVIPLEELYRYCQIARDILQGDHAVGRVIARPFVGVPTAFRRTTNRHDYSLKPPGRLAFDVIREAGQEVAAIGKIYDIYAGQGFSRHVSTRSNMEGVDHTLAYMREVDQGLIMTNLVDFDMLYGHRNDPEGYAQALQDFDARLPEILAALAPEDLLILTADHGCDPTTASTDHSREYVPVLLTGREVQHGVDVGVRSTFADVGETVLAWLGLPSLGVGQVIEEVRHAGL